jgi:O6-methylguanine-DNA--protein-cysteine methyltransferase
LQRLIGDRRISQGEVFRYVSDMRREIDELEQRLQRLREASVAAMEARPGRRPGRPPAAPGRQRRRSRPLTAERRASQQLQGRYLGLIRQIPAGRRAHYTKVAKDKGREAAIKEMASALGR